MLLAAAAPAFGLPCANTVSAQTLSVSQVDYYLNGSLHTANSRYGEMSFAYTGAATPMFLNVVNQGAAAAQAVGSCRTCRCC
jgi:hypothetical protein